MATNQRTLLITWELGGGQGHLLHFVPIVQRLKALGYRVYAAVRELAQVDGILGKLGVSYLQAPIKARRSHDRIDPLRTFAHILHNSGYSDPSELKAMVEAWRHLFDFVRPDVVLCDHAPTALLAARTCQARRAVIGSGFCCVPDEYPLSDFRPRLPDASERLKQDEERILANVNRVLDGQGAAPLERISQLYREVDATFLTTFPELDHYPAHTNPDYYGVWPGPDGLLPQWPDMAGKRVFAYLHPFRGLPNLLGYFNQLRCPTIAYVSRVNPRLKDQFESPTLQFASGRMDLTAVGSTCDLAVINAGHGTTASMLLAGKPQLDIPIHLEQTLNGKAVERLGAGLSAWIDRPTEITAKLTTLLDSDQYAEGARRFAARYTDFDPQEAICRIVERIDQLAASRADQKRGSDERPRQRRPNHQASARAVVALGNSPTILLGIGSGRCGTRSLAVLLSRQPSTAVWHESRPLLPWDTRHSPQTMQSRFTALIQARPNAARVGDVAHFYLPYIEEIIEAFPAVRVICLKRDREETAESYARWIAQTRRGAPVDHWRSSRTGLVPDVWDQCFPKYPVTDLREGVRCYWDEYYQRAEELVIRFPDKIRIFDTAATLNDPERVGWLLDWAGIPTNDHDFTVVHANKG